MHSFPNTHSIHTLDSTHKEFTAFAPIYNGALANSIYTNDYDDVCGTMRCCACEWKTNQLFGCLFCRRRRWSQVAPESCGESCVLEAIAAGWRFPLELAWVLLSNTVYPSTFPPTILLWLHFYYILPEDRPISCTLQKEDSGCVNRCHFNLVQQHLCMICGFQVSDGHTLRVVTHIT